MAGQGSAAPIDVRSRILDAAQRLFSARGAEAVTMANVADEARVARATVFNQFGSKHALIEAITEGVFTGYALLLDWALAERETSTPSLVRELFERMGVGIEEQRRFYREVFREIAKITVGLDEGGVAQRARLEAIDRLERLLMRGQARGELAREFEPGDLAVAFDSLVFGTITHWLYDESSQSLRSQMRRAADILLGSVALEPGARRVRATRTPRRKR